MILFSILFLIIGFIGLYIGAKFIIIGLENIADRLHISQIMVGLTILAIGTSLPEIAVSVMGAFDKLLGIDPNIDGIVIGNKVGSFLTQITLIIGILAVSQPLFVSKWELRREGPMLFISVLIFLFFSLDGLITQFEALLMLIIYFVYLILIIWSEKRLVKTKSEVRFADKQRLDPMSFEAIESPHKTSSLFKDISFTLIGLLILLVTAEFTLLSAHDLAREFSIPENVIGILIVGFGTSLPELVADLTAIRRKSYGIAIGDILGSNICDILLATGSGAIFVNFNVPIVILIFDLPILFLALSITISLLWTHKTLKKWEGALLIGFYGIYVIVKLLFFQI
ncbi:MAG: calcium/sodium antiporter [Candidatus Lokiarchaeota archaeon]|nr:calcium/sodium antiporter [Candidatus Lokiarchaeota archaeon]